MSKSCYIYCRCADNNDFAKLACEMRKKEMLKYAEEHGLTVAAIGLSYCESGLSKDRQSIRTMLAEVKKQHIDVVLVYRLTRLGRNMRFVHDIAAELDKTGTKIMSVLEGELNSISHGLALSRVGTPEQLRRDANELHDNP